MSGTIAIVGLWHLGCSIAASWLRLDQRITAVEFDGRVVTGLREGRAPLFEPGVDETLAEGLKRGTLSVRDRPDGVRDCAFVFVAYDTPVREDDSSDLTPIRTALDQIGPYLATDAIVIVSAQLPVGEARRLRARLRQAAPSAELVYSPENLRLGEAMACYLKPGHIVIGAETTTAADRVAALFAPMQASIFRMNLPSAEMTKHCINSFLATSVTLANQWADIAAATGADFGDVARALRSDPRIGEKAYLTPGIGFSGGTLGRDLRVLDGVSRETLGGSAPLFGQVWDYNQRRVEVVARRAEAILGGLRGQRLALLGMTYKPGTSTLRRSLPLAVARDVLAKGATAAAHDPRADWRETPLPAGLQVAESPYAAAKDADLVVLLTEWPEYRELDFGRLAALMHRPLLFDTKDFLRPRREALAAAGLRHIVLGSSNQ
ncbi:MAG: UDP-glucose/GDP-mannose dehydrogenase family protein [Gemmatimonadetes bacterium]|nr:UDP-glucose/GDP-mannose dehydrogenase family protein [Gemmatimonadota bacterium]